LSSRINNVQRLSSRLCPFPDISLGDEAKPRHVRCHAEMRGNIESFDVSRVLRKTSLVMIKASSGTRELRKRTRITRNRRGTRRLMRFHSMTTRTLPYAISHLDEKSLQRVRIPIQNILYARTHARGRECVRVPDAIHSHALHYFIIIVAHVRFCSIFQTCYILYVSREYYSNASINKQQHN